MNKSIKINLRATNFLASGRGLVLALILAGLALAGFTRLSAQDQEVYGNLTVDSNLTAGGETTLYDLNVTNGVNASYLNAG
ncbi:MAG TPA: hypothetical protein VK737_01585 [Opitutales bacterium]|jgi:hypothetical protein|nr:hypothetical protein [Opitutales bacterium]